MTRRVDFDVVVVGGGMVGATTACLLARAGFSTAVVEAREMKEFKPGETVGLRVSAIAPGSQAILKQAGAWGMVERSRHCTYRRMQVEDRNGSTALEFNAAEFGMEQLGSIVENDLLQWSLWQSLGTQAGVELLCPAQIETVDLDGEHPRLLLRGGREISCSILVGADGPESMVRAAAGIAQDSWAYGQQGIVCVVRTLQDNTGLAWQRFLPGGPLAFLPLDDGSSSIVWSLPDAQVRHMLQLDDTGFCEALNEALNGESLNGESLDTAADGASGQQWVFGAVTGCGPRAAFPLTMQLSAKYAAGNTVLVGDAAHVVHPLAGQGVNLGLLDAAALLETLVQARNAGEDFAGEAVLRRYARWRRSEAELMARGVHHLRSLFLPDWLGPLRQFGLGMVNRSWTLKEGFIRRAAGLNRNAPALSRGQGISELLRRF